MNLGHVGIAYLKHPQDFYEIISTEKGEIVSENIVPNAESVSISNSEFNLYERLDNNDVKDSIVVDIENVYVNNDVNTSEKPFMDRSVV